MIVFLSIWLALLTIFVALGFVMVIGKFARMERQVNEVLEKVYDDIEEIHGVLNTFLEDFKNLKTQVENLETLDGKTSENLSQVFTLVREVTETQTGLQRDLDNCVRVGDEEYPVTAVLEPAKNRGGRPKKTTV